MIGAILCRPCGVDPECDMIAVTTNADGRLSCEMHSDHDVVTEADR